MRPVDPALRAAERGYVLLTLVLLGALVAAAALGFARHAILAGDDAVTSLSHQVEENALGSGMAFATQSLRVDGTVGDSADLAGEQVSFAVSDLSATLRQITVSATGADGSPQALTLNAEVLPAAGGTQLPAMTVAARQAVRTAPDLIDLDTDQTIADTVLDGIVLLRKGTQLTLRDVVVRGAIISENALLSPPWDDEVELVLEGGVLIDATGVLDGLAIAIPDSVVDGSHSSARLQVHGTVVAKGLLMAGDAALHGELATLETPVFAGRKEFPGAGRAPRAWPDTLSFTSGAVSRVVVPISEPSGAEKTAIRNFAWPAVGTQGSLAPSQAPGGD